MNLIHFASDEKEGASSESLPLVVEEEKLEFG